MTAGVGADIEALCNKCGDVWHVVVAKVGSDIVKVQCKECGGYHRYRSATAPSRSSRAARSPARARRAAGSRASARNAAPPPPAFAPDPSAPVKAYSMRETFQTGDHIQHPRFGLGVVERSSEPGKMHVVFADGPRVLAQAKRASSLGTADQVAPLRRADES